MSLEGLLHIRLMGVSVSTIWYTTGMKGK